MKKITALLTGLFCLGTLASQAVTVESYVEKFDNLASSLNETFAPAKWGRIADGLYPIDWGPATYVTYSGVQAGGQDGGYLKVGSQELWDYDTGDYIAHDLIVTPAVSGEVSFYLRKQSTSTVAEVELYSCTKNGDRFTRGSLLKTVADADFTADGWTKITYTDIADGTYIGFRLSNVHIDEFTAASAEVEAKRTVEIKSLTLKSDSKAYANEDGDVTINFEYTLLNTGDVDLAEGEATVTLFDYSETPEKDLITVPVCAIAQGATTTPQSISVTLNTTEYYRHRFDLRENLKGTSKYGAWVEVFPYKPIFTFCTPESSLKVESIDFGFIKDAAATKTFRIKNTGPAPMNITSIALPAGYSMSVTAPATVDPLSETLVDITLGLDNVGTCTGNIVFSCEGLEDYPVAVSGIVIDENAWYENFEANELPSNMIFGESWETVALDSKWQTPTNKYCVAQGNSTNLSKMISPKLTVAEDESLVFYAAKRSYSGCKLSVYYSTDRENWQLAKTIESNEFSTESGSAYYDMYKLTPFTVDNIPAGEWYVAFEAGNVRIDDIFGYAIASVENDLYISAKNMPIRGKVNTDYTATITVNNFGQTLAADSYTVTLYADDEAVATAETVEFEAATSETFTMTYKPHYDGEIVLRAEIAVGDYKVSSSEATATIYQESGSECRVIGEAKTTSSNIPMTINYERSQSEVIYKAAVLGLSAGTKINKIGYMGYCANDKDVTTHIRIFAQNTEDTEADVSAPVDTTTMTLVYEGDYKFPVLGSDKEPVEIFFAQFTKPFEYTGNNLRIFVHADSGEGWKQVTFNVDNTLPEGSIYRYSDNGIDKIWSYYQGFPVTNIYTERTVPTLGGVVKNAAEEALANVAVKIESADGVIYETVTDEAGAYTMDVFQYEKEYTLTATVEGYQTYSTTLTVSEEGKVLDIVMTKKIITSVDEVAAGMMIIAGGDGVIFVNASEAAVVKVYGINGVLVREEAVEAGVTRIEIPSGFYIVNGKKVIVR